MKYILWDKGHDFYYTGKEWSTDVLSAKKYTLEELEPLNNYFWGKGQYRVIVALLIIQL